MNDASYKMFAVLAGISMQDKVSKDDIVDLVKSIGDYCVERVKEDVKDKIDINCLNCHYNAESKIAEHLKECHPMKNAYTPSTNLVDIDIADLEINVCKLKRLLDDKEFGLSTWWGFVQKRIDKISKYRSLDV